MGQCRFREQEYLAEEIIDPYIAYRLIEPGYESWRNISICAWDVNTFKEKVILRNSSVGQACVNCHSFEKFSGDRMLLHVRGEGGGTVFVDGKNVTLKNLAETGHQGTYPSWNPKGRYVTFSSNTTNQEFTVDSYPHVEVYDTASDLYVYDTETEEMITCPQLSTEDELETFPCRSADGRTLYYCSAHKDSPDQDCSCLHYRILSIAFEDGSFAGEPQVVFDDPSMSCSFPRVTGDWMMFTAADYGTFPIWHKEADLMMLNLRTGEFWPAEELNSEDTESYHSWSSNGRWVVFSSRRVDSRYTRLYIARHYGNGHFSKPFMLPQRNPQDNELRLQSYNVPEFLVSMPEKLDRKIGRLFR